VDCPGCKFGDHTDGRQQLAWGFLMAGFGAAARELIVRGYDRRHTWDRYQQFFGMTVQSPSAAVAQDVNPTLARLLARTYGAEPMPTMSLWPSTAAPKIATVRGDLTTAKWFLRAGFFGGGRLLVTRAVWRRTPTRIVVAIRSLRSRMGR
jgi:hypothetical protein